MMTYSKWTLLYNFRQKHISSRIVFNLKSQYNVPSQSGSIMKNKELFLLISIIPQRTSEITILRELKEVKALVESYGGIVVDLITQHREVHDKGMYIGQGKVTEVLKRIEEMKIGVVVLNATVKPGQLFDLKKLFRESSPNIEVWDRIDLILEIFSKHADTAEAKLQIDLAAMRHMGPRIYGMGFV